MALCSLGRSTLVLTFVLGLVTVESAIRRSAFPDAYTGYNLPSLRETARFRWLVCMEGAGPQWLQAIALFGAGICGHNFAKGQVFPKRKGAEEPAAIGAVEHQQQ